MSIVSENIKHDYIISYFLIFSLILFLSFPFLFHIFNLKAVIHLMLVRTLRRRERLQAECFLHIRQEDSVYPVFKIVSCVMKQFFSDEKSCDGLAEKPFGIRYYFQLNKGEVIFSSSSSNVRVLHKSDYSI